MHATMHTAKLTSWVTEDRTHRDSAGNWNKPEQGPNGLTGRVCSKSCLEFVGARLLTIGNVWGKFLMPYLAYLHQDAFTVCLCMVKDNIL